jgi:hypothetical protein
VTPVVNLWFPLQLLRDVVRASIPGTRTAVRLGIWWTCWLLWLGAEPWVPGLIFDHAPDSTRLLGLFETVGALLMLGAFTVWITTILRVTKAQEAWLEQRVAPAPAVGHPSGAWPPPWSPPQP